MIKIVQILLIIPCYLAFGFSENKAQNNSLYNDVYNLEIGVERHFISPCIGMMVICPTHENHFETAVEKVVSDTLIGDKKYAVVIWEDFNSSLSDTVYFRMNDSILYEYKMNDNRAIFDFGFSVGDSLYNYFNQFVSEEVLEDPSYFYITDYDRVGPTIVLDTLLQFSDGVIRNVMWGDDTLKINDNVYPPPKTLDFTNDAVWLKNLPVPDHYLGISNPFYFISGIGVILTPFNHPDRMMCGYRTSEGEHFGCNVDTITSTKKTVIPAQKVLLSNYPNPFNPQTTISFTIPIANFARLMLYDTAGRRLSVIKECHFTQGEHKITFDTANYASGVYFIVMKYGRSQYILPITFLK